MEYKTSCVHAKVFPIFSLFRRSCFSVVELIVILLMGLLELSVAIVLSAGLERTCKAFKRAAGEDLP